MSTTPELDRSRLPTFLIIGAPKSGTTSLAAYLSGHPQVFMSRDKELHFFDDNYELGLDWYRSQFSAAGDALAIGEASPTYFLRPDAVERMAGTLPDARLVAILRNPIEAVWSNYWMQRSLGFDRRSFERAIRDELAGRRPSRLEGRGLRYIEGGRYIAHLLGVCERYPRSSLLVLLFDDLRDDPTSTFASLCRFIGVNEVVAPPNLGEVINPATRLRSERLRHWMLRYHAWKRLPRRLAAAIDRWNRYPAAYPEMDPGLRAELVAIFAQGNTELGAWLGRDLSAWNV